MNKNVPLEAYPDDTSRRSAELLQAASSAKFDGSDLMPNAMNQAFFEAIVEYVAEPRQPRHHPRQPRHRPGRRLRRLTNAHSTAPAA